MNKRLYYYPLAIIILAISLGLFGWFAETSSVRWVALAFGLALIAVGLGVYSLILALQTEKKVTDMVAVIARIEGLADTMKQELGEGRNSGVQIIPTLEAFSKSYLDYMNRPQDEDKK